MTSKEPRMWDAREGLDEFERAIPTHECENGEQCTHPGAFYMFAHDEGEVVTVSSGTHGASPGMVLQAVIQVMDSMFINSAPDGMSAMIAWAHGREAMKRAVERVPAPGEVGFNVDSFIKDLTSNLGAEGDE